MGRLSVVVRRHFDPTLAMLREVVVTCPDSLLTRSAIGIREHVYHIMVGMDIWLSPDPRAYPFDEIVESDAAEFGAPLSDRISRAFLLAYLERLEASIAALPDDDVAYLDEVTLRGRHFTLLDRCLGQLRHAQHHIGVINERLSRQDEREVDWQGYGEG
jgi:hypothetical protein